MFLRQHITWPRRTSFVRHQDGLKEITWSCPRTNHKATEGDELDDDGQRRSNCFHFHFAITVPMNTDFLHPYSSCQPFEVYSVSFRGSLFYRKFLSLCCNQGESVIFSQRRSVCNTQFWWNVFEKCYLIQLLTRQINGLWRFRNLWQFIKDSDFCTGFHGTWNICTL